MRNRNHVLWLLLIPLLVALGFYFIHVKAPIASGHDARQAYTLMTARVFAMERFNPLQPEIDCEGNPGIHVLEFPFYQMLVSLFYIDKDSGILAGRAMNIFLTFLTSIYLFRLGREKGSLRTGWLAALLFLLTPFQLVFGRSTLIDVLTVTSGMGFLYHAFIYRKRGFARDLVYSSIWFTVGLLTKFFLLLPVVIPALHLFFHDRSWARERWKSLIPYLIGCVLLLLWMKHAASLNRMHVMTEEAHGLTSELFSWYFGTFKQYTSIAYLVDLAFRLRYLVPHLCGYLFFIVGLLMISSGRFHFERWWGVGSLAYLLLFVNLNQTHEYYQLPVIPFFSWVCARGGIALYSVLRKGTGTLRRSGNGFRAAVLTSLVVSILGLNLYFVCRETGFYNINRKFMFYGQIIEDKTQPGEIVGFLGEHGRNPSVFFHAQRRGLFMDEKDLQGQDRLKTLMTTKGLNVVIAIFEEKGFLEKRKRLERLCTELGFSTRYMEDNVLVMALSSS